MVWLTTRLSGFKSACTMPLAARKLSPASSCLVYESTCVFVLGGWVVGWLVK
jgi:hypothetical protein